jgi:DNA (cytosine-5)-methyltransferase 1
MRHFGDITKINGARVPIVDTVIFGAPCQDLSVAGKRAGMKHGDLGDDETTRSGLFMEAVRIIKEMRDRDKRNGRAGVAVRPRYGVYENVPGAFSSNRGLDFRIVLEELAKVADENAVIPMPDKGKWTSCGCIMGDGWSIAWRILDAQFWGVHQRRRRIALIADFGGHSAPEILFVRKGVSGDSDESKPPREATPSDATGSVGADDSIGIDLYNTAITGDVSATLGINFGMSHGRNGVLCYDIGEARLRTPSEYQDLSPTLSARCGTGGNNTPAVITFEPGIASREGGHIYEGVSGTLRANAGDNQMATDYTMQDREGCAGGGKGALIQEEKSASLMTNNFQYLFQPVTFSKAKRAQSDTDYETWKESDTANTLNGFDTGDVRTSEAVVYALDRASYNQGKNAQYDFEVSDRGINSPLVAKGPGAVAYGINGDKAGTLDASYYKGCGMRSGVEREVIAKYIDTSHADDVVRIDDTVAPLQARDYKGGKLIAAVDCRNATEDLINGALQSNSAHSLNGNNVVRTRYIVRRLTPLECERLQGYPDGWTDIGDWVDSNGKTRKTSDAARYKALGNSIALPPWKWVLKRLCACYERDATMASLFDGIGGFPLLWEQLNGKGSCLWASEIEEFPMAVTKVRIG